MSVQALEALDDGEGVAVVEADAPEDGVDGMETDVPAALENDVDGIEEDVVVALENDVEGMEEDVVVVLENDVDGMEGELVVALENDVEGGRLPVKPIMFSMLFSRITTNTLVTIRTNVPMIARSMSCENILPVNVSAGIQCID